MNLCAIICEYNPMHNGHIYQMNQAKILTSANGILCLIGGNFNQRGLPCVFNKNIKAEIALRNGADIVCELPSAFCIQSAEIFALSSIKMLNSIKNVTHLCFGSECGDISLLDEIASFLLKPNKDFQNSFKKYINEGFSYSVSIEKSIGKKEWLEVIKKPNNLLAIEYLKAIKITKSPIIPVTIKRTDNYNDTATDKDFISATAIRNAISSNNIQNIKNKVPNETFKYLQNISIDSSKFESICNYCININKSNINNIYEVNEGIENYLAKTSSPTSRYKINKINRTKLNIMLNIEKKLIKKLYKIKKLPYIKILACKKNILPELKCSTKLITRKNDINKKNKYFKQLEIIDNNSNILYNIISNTNLSHNSLYEKSLYI